MSRGRADVEWLRSARKVDLVVEIARTVGVSAPPMSTGSKEPRALFVLVNEQLGLGVDPKLRKPEIARAIVEASGGAWQPDFESRGSTITKTGLVAVLEAVRFFLG